MRKVLPILLISVLLQVGMGMKVRGIEGRIPARKHDRQTDLQPILDLSFVSPTIFEGKMTRPWTRVSDHIGPTENQTPLGASLYGKTYCGLLTLAAGTAAWCARRLDGRTDVSTLLNLVEVLFAYQSDWRYFDRKALPYKKDVKNSKMEPAVAAKVEMAIRNMMFAKFFWKTGRIPDSGVFHSAHLVRYVLPNGEQKKFQTWIHAASDRLEEIAARPHRSVPYESKSTPEYDVAINSCHGLPLPPEILDVTQHFELGTRSELVSKFLTSLDWASNPLLASPQQMLANGFKGEPYA